MQHNARRRGDRRACCFPQTLSTFGGEALIDVDVIGAPCLQPSLDRAKELRRRQAIDHAMIEGE